MTDDFSEFDIIERHAKEAARKQLEDAKAANEHLRMAEECEADARRASALKLSLSTNEMIRLAEYDVHNVAPPPGTRATIGLLFQLGWRIDESLGQRNLVPPVPVERRTRQDYINDQNT